MGRTDIFYRIIWLSEIISDIDNNPLNRFSEDDIWILLHHGHLPAMQCYQFVDSRTTHTIHIELEMPPRSTLSTQRVWWFLTAVRDFTYFHFDNFPEYNLIKLPRPGDLHLLFLILASLLAPLLLIKALKPARLPSHSTSKVVWHNSA